MSAARRYWYLNKHKPVQVLARQISECTWYLPELNISVDGTNLFRTSTGVLRALRRKIDEEIKKRQFPKKPHPDAEPTKYGYLWLVKGGLSEGKKSGEEKNESVRTPG